MHRWMRRFDVNTFLDIIVTKDIFNVSKYAPITGQMPILYKDHSMYRKAWHYVFMREV
jgi:hypothetical protein